jgi:KDO2-lipid IV(A) lauroyltransferase
MEQKEQHHQLLYYVVYALWYLLSLLPLVILYVLSDLIYCIVYKVIGYRIKVVRGNLESSFPEKSEEELRQIERRFYHNLCDYFVETIKMMTMSERQMRRRMVFKGTEDLDACVADGQSCAIYLGHLFNWEWITSLPFWVSKETHCGQLYHALENPAFDQLLLQQRQRWGAECIALVDILRKTIEYKRQQQSTVIGYIGDQVPHWNNIHHWCHFLNHDTPVMTGAERIAVKNNQALFYMNMRRVKRGYYEAEVKLITRQPKTLREYESVDIYFQMLEQNIRCQPELWLWSHNRWKRTREEFNRRFVVIDGKVVQKVEE